MEISLPLNDFHAAVEAERTRWSSFQACRAGLARDMLAVQLHGDNAGLRRHKAMGVCYMLLRLAQQLGALGIAGVCSEVWPGTAPEYGRSLSMFSGSASSSCNACFNMDSYAGRSTTLYSSDGFVVQSMGLYSLICETSPACVRVVRSIPMTTACFDVALAQQQVKIVFPVGIRESGAVGCQSQSQCLPGRH